ncbi:methionine--tRNA ligase [Candidatus Falkowbacteria bacterium]|uniref:Methionine--tRNA ligase n=1 Tax=Candidatus Buchananbacteria bacterium CG10_big_fil_rev_8_21_14_0_10_33_19 TaxID=1974525 RepID=A0A2H0W4C0_9BACT|nr:methionine--tRNA ligase [Candidatus Falkowbacteria bacterium]PIS06203.1 MAG: methionine--tRNA ligase [Candidatus Buchananbacteria bacterium CG10_big_fil_rev_8_21_14_0_10_33_19]
MNKFYITTPIYYVNDKPHIGHAYTTIAADVLARFHRLKGEEVFFLTGTDEHGAKVAASAEQAGKLPQDFCDENSAKFQLIWDRLNISNDHFIRTTSDQHKAGVEKFLTKLKEVGAVYEGDYSGLYCTGCEKFITEKELVNGLCPDHKKEPEVLKEKNYFFKLSDYLPKIAELINNGELKILPENKKNEVLGLIKQGMDDFSISRESVKWGIKIPFSENQVTYVWVEALQNYITGIGYGSDDKTFNKFWPANIHLMAKDIIKFHALYWPAMLLAAGLPLPEVVFAHGFFTIDGEKMSKSLGNVIDPDVLVDEFGSDAVRYLLLSQFPFGADGDVKAGNFVIQYNSDLANGIGNLTSRVLSMVEKYLDSIVPVKDFEFSDEVAGIWHQYEDAMKRFQIDDVIEIIRKLNSFADGYVERQKPWQLAKEDKDQLNKVLYNLLESVRHLALMVYPVMPEVSEKIFGYLNQADWKNKSFKELVDWGGLESGQKVEKPQPLFPRLEK